MVLIFKSWIRLKDSYFSDFTKQLQLRTSKTKQHKTYLCFQCTKLSINFSPYFVYKSKMKN